MSSNKLNHIHHHRNGSSSSNTTSSTRSSPRSLTSKRKSEILCSICLKETIPILSREKLFSIQYFCSMSCYSKQVVLEDAVVTNNNSESSATSNNNNLSATASAGSSFRKFNYNSNNITNFIKV